MNQQHMNKDKKLKLKEDVQLNSELTTDCSRCFGLCCVALYFSTMDGFPSNKSAGIACGQLNETFGCAVHDQLKEKGYKGCMGYDCIGAGQKICQQSFNGRDWRTHQELKQQMFELLPIMRGLHELLWFLRDLKRFEVAIPLYGDIDSLYDEVQQLTQQSPKTILAVNLNAYRQKVNEVLTKGSELVREQAIRFDVTPSGKRPNLSRGANLMGKDMRKFNLVGAQLRGAMLIAANFQHCDLSGADLIGADMRDTNVYGADLSKALFLTQNQLNVSKGNQETKIPNHLVRPSHWV